MQRNKPTNRGKILCFDRGRRTCRGRQPYTYLRGLQAHERIFKALPDKRHLYFVPGVRRPCPCAVQGFDMRNRTTVVNGKRLGSYPLALDSPVQIPLFDEEQKSTL